MNRDRSRLKMRGYLYHGLNLKKAHFVRFVRFDVIS